MFKVLCSEELVTLGCTILGGVPLSGSATFSV